MATPESIQPAAGPRYAPDDPTLPKPWRGLIDGSTGILYYWNPETNVTQYEKPAPLPTAPPQASSAPKLAQIPMAHSLQQQQQAQPISQWPPQQGHLTMAPPEINPNLHAIPDLGAKLGQPAQPLGHSMSQVMQHPAPQMLSQAEWQAPQEGNCHLPQPSHQMQNLTGQQMLHHQGSQVSQSQGQQFAYQQMQQPMAYQRNMLLPVQHGSQQQMQLPMQGQQLPFNQFECEAGFPPPIGNKVDTAQKNQATFSASLCHPANVSTSQAPPAGSKSVLYHPASSFFSQTQQFGGSPSVEQPASMVPYQQERIEFAHHQLQPSFQNNANPSIMHNQQYSLPPLGAKIGCEDQVHGGAGDGYLANAKVQGPMASSCQPKLASLPMTRNQQDSRIAGDACTVNSAGQPRHLHSNTAETPSFPINNALGRAPFIPPFDNTGLSPAEVYRQQHEVTATGGNIPAPFVTFEAAGFPPEILRDILSAGFLSPTPIQAQTWPIALENRDIVAIAKTGSGKTLGYLIPAFILLRKRRNNPQNGPTVLVMAPTRELASQIQEEVKKFGRSSRISCTCLYGGAPKGPQLEQLDRGADIVVATPGRLNDILEMKKIRLGQVSLLVLDEADRMLDMGFEPQIRKIVNEIPTQRQTLMYTATWPKEVRKIASDLLVSPIQVNIGSIDELAANKSITQYVEVVPQMEKERRLNQILREQDRGSKVIIFCSTKRLCDQLARSIGRNFGAAAIHGDKSQGERDWVLNQFRSGMSPILVATDVAARGLDIKDIRVVINYDFPNGIEDYVHRIGRTGRAGATGVSYTFFSEQDWKYAADLVKLLEGANQHVPPEVQQIALHGGSGGRYRGGMSRADSGMANGGEHWGFGQRDFGGRGRGGMRTSGFNGHGGTRDGGFNIRDSAKDVRGRGGRNDFFSGRGNRGRGSGGPLNWGRNDRGPLGRSNYADGHGRGFGRGRFDGRRELERSRGRSYSRSPERARKRSYNRSRDRSRSRSRSWSRSRSRSWSRGRSRSYSRSPRHSRSPNHSRSPGGSRGCSRSRSSSHGRITESSSHGRVTESGFDRKEILEQVFKAHESEMSPMPPAMNVEPLPGSEYVQGAVPVNDETAVESSAINQ